MRRHPAKKEKIQAPPAVRDHRLVQIGCPEPHGEGEDLCPKCGLPLVHHQVRFEILDYDDDYDRYVLHAVTHGTFDPHRGMSLRKHLLHISGGAFESFRECT